MPLAWEAQFPHLGNWEKTSERTPEYNCAAFAAGEQDRRWDPFPPGLDYWPKGVRRSYDSEDFQAAYATIRYSLCENGNLESDFEKIVLYTNYYDKVTHVARQLPDGRWTSKIGDEEDIAHERPESLLGGYGTPTRYMKRRRENDEGSPQ